MEADDNRERQQAEIELLSAMYPEEFEDRGSGSVSIKLEGSLPILRDNGLTNNETGGLTMSWYRCRDSSD